MLHKLTLTNFGIHKHLEINFTKGLNVVRGDNEAGKSTMLHAVAYALGGVSAVPNKASADLATWGMPESSYKVELEFSHVGERYTITRSKSGAYLRGSATSVTGHAPVSNAVENLLGLPASLLPVILFANQKSLSDHVKSSTKGVIQQLAKLDLLDVWAEKIKATLPTGLTKSLESVVDSMEMVEPSASIVKELEAQVAQASIDCRKLWVLTGFNSSTDLLAYVRHTATQIAEYEENLAKLHKKVAAQDAYLKSLLGKAPLIEVSIQNISSLDTALGNLQKQLTDLQEVSKLVKLRDRVPTLNDWSKFGGWVPQPAKALEAENIVYGELSVKIPQLEQRRSTLLQRVQQTNLVCTSCGQPLKGAEAIAKARAEALAEIIVVDKALDQEVSRRSENLDRLVILKRLNSEISSRMSMSKVNFDFDTGVFTWSGPSNLKELTDDGLNMAQVSQRIQQLESAKANLLRNLQEAKTFHETLVQVKTGLEHATTELQTLQTKEPEIVVKRSRQQYLQSVAPDFQCAEAHLETLASNLVKAQSDYSTAKARYDDDVKRRVKLTKLIAETKFNNAVVAKLQKVKRALSTELWACLLASVSTILTQIRGVPSEVSMVEDQFTLDGQKWSLHSGSTQDSLGLAIRLALLNYFLPSLGFIILDEPGGAMSDVREGNMLSSLSQAGLDQVLLVTHSEVADSFAHNLIDLQDFYA